MKPLSSDASLPSCGVVEDRIHELLDLRQSLLADELVREHVAECDTCAELVVDFGALNDSLSQIPVATLHRLSGLHSDEPASKNSRRLHPISFVASVACLMLVMLTAGVWFPSENPIDVSSAEIETTELASVDSDPVTRDYVSASAFPSLEFAVAALPYKMSPPSEFINAVSFEKLSGEVEPYQGYIEMTADLPWIRSVSRPVSATYHLLRFISEVPAAPKTEKPSDLPTIGYRGVRFLRLCSV